MISERHAADADFSLDERSLRNRFLSGLIRDHPRWYPRRPRAVVI
jgi:hypothetical protein